MVIFFYPIMVNTNIYSFSLFCKIFFFSVQTEFFKQKCRIQAIINSVNKKYDFELKNITHFWFRIEK